MNFHEALAASLAGEFDGDKGGRQPVVRLEARHAAEHILATLTDLDFAWSKIYRAKRANVFTDDDMVWLGQLQAMLALRLGELPNLGMMASTRARQGGR
jgi:hypothetical protein